MKKLILLLILTLILTLALVSCKPDPVSQNQPPIAQNPTSYTVNGEPILLECDKNAHLSYTGTADVSVTFHMPNEHYTHLERNCYHLSFSASVTDSFGLTLPAMVTDIGEIGSDHSLSVSIGGVFAEDYLESYTVTLTVSFTDEKLEKREIALSSDPFTVYDVAYLEYTDRSEESVDGYRHFTGDDYSPYADLGGHYSILSSALVLTRSGDRLLDRYEGGAYTSLYSVEYFDGLITISMKNGSEINPGLLKNITLDGESVYFEIHEGIIRIVTEGR